METSNEHVVPEHYNPNQLVTYKVINDGAATYPTSKVVDIEYALELGRRSQKSLNDMTAKVRQLEGELAGWIENEADAADIVSEICTIFGFNPTKEIEFEATVNVTGVVRIPLTEIAEFDISDLELDVDVSSYSYDIDVYDTTVDHVREG